MCDRADESVLETAAVSAAPPIGGPEQMAIFVVLKKGFTGEPDKLKMLFSRAIQTNLNPLFKVCASDQYAGFRSLLLQAYSSFFVEVRVFYFLVIILCYLISDRILCRLVSNRYNDKISK